MNFRPCNWCGGPVPVRKESCPRCGTPSDNANSNHSSLHTYDGPPSTDSDVSRLLLIVASFLATTIGIYIVMQGETTGESHFLLIGISFAVFGVCGLVSAEQTPGMEMNRE